jgi:hypothetical protein
VRAIGVRDLTASIATSRWRRILCCHAVVAGGLGAAAPIAYLVARR